MPASMAETLVAIQKELETLRTMNEALVKMVGEKDTRLAEFKIEAAELRGKNMQLVKQLKELYTVAHPATAPCNQWVRLNRALTDARTLLKELKAI